MSDKTHTPTIICNSGPLIALVSIDCLYILSRLYQRIIIPNAVYQEVTSSKDLTGSQQIAQESWIEKKSLNSSPDRLLRAELGAGESEVITLAMELNASKVLIDERKARRIAKLIYSLNITGTGGLLVRAKQNDIIKEVRPLLERMKANGYYLSDRLVSRIAQEAGE
jgi:hypothetical protein